MSEKRKRSGARSSQYRLSGSSSSYAARNSAKRKRKNRLNYPVIIVMALFVIMVTGLLIVGIGKLKGGKAEEETVPAETELTLSVSVDGVNITGMSKAEAHDAIMKKYSWGMKAVLEGAEDDTYEIPNMIELEVNEFLDEIYAGEPKESYEIKFTGLDDEIAAEASAMAKKWNREAKNGSISGFDKESSSFIYSGEENGLAIDEEKLKSDIAKAVEEKNFKTVINVASSAVPPAITKEQAKEMYKVIGTYTTNTTSNNDRNTNIKIAAEAIDGMIIQPGEEFSFNATTGNRTLEKGYKPAGAYVNGVLVEEPGGGVCQVSSTLYNAVVFSGLTTTERHAHTFEPSYVTPGEDAMVSYDGYAGPDMKFVNTSKSAIAIRAKYADRKITMSIVGIPILEEGVKISMHSEKVAEYDPPEPVYEEDATVMPGAESVSKEAKPGSRWVTNIVKKKDGNIISDEFFHNSTYKGKPATIKRNINGETVAESQESGESSESAAQDDNGNVETRPTAETSGEVPAGPGQKPSAAEPSAPVRVPTQGSTEGPGSHSTSAPETVPVTEPEEETIEALHP